MGQSQEPGGQLSPEQMRSYERIPTGRGMWPLIWDCSPGQRLPRDFSIIGAARREGSRGRQTRSKHCKALVPLGRRLIRKSPHPQEKHDVGEHSPPACFCLRFPFLGVWSPQGRRLLGYEDQKLHFPFGCLETQRGPPAHPRLHRIPGATGRLHGGFLDLGIVTLNP